VSRRLADRDRRRVRAAIDAVLILIIIILMVQMWLLTAALESVLAGHHDVALPGLLTSLALFAACAGLYRLVVRLDRSPGPEDPSSEHGPWAVG
jgi:hypothetical protein